MELVFQGGRRWRGRNRSGIRWRPRIGGRQWGPEKVVREIQTGQFEQCNIRQDEARQRQTERQSRQSGVVECRGQRSEARPLAEAAFDLVCDSLSDARAIQRPRMRMEAERKSESGPDAKNEAILHSPRSAAFPIAALVAPENLLSAGTSAA